MVYMVHRRVKNSTNKTHFWLFFIFWLPGLGQNLIQKFWTARLYDHTFQIFPCQIWGWSNWPCSTDYLRSLVKYGFLNVPAKMTVFVTSLNDNIVLTVFKVRKNSCRGQAQSCQFSCRSRKGFWFTASKKMFTILLSKKKFFKQILFPFQKLGPRSPNAQGYQHGNIA